MNMHEKVGGGEERAAKWAVSLLKQEKKNLDLGTHIWFTKKHMLFHIFMLNRRPNDHVCIENGRRRWRRSRGFPFLRSEDSNTFQKALIQAHPGFYAPICLNARKRGRDFPP